MNNFIKIGFLGSLALGGVAAHATIVTPSSSGSSGDVLLFADIVKSGSIVDSYAGDTGVTVNSAAHGTQPANYAASGDANLSAFLGEATTGTTVIWSVIGGGGNGTGGLEFVTTTPKNSVNGTNGSVLNGWAQGLTQYVNTINGSLLQGGPGTSVKTTDFSTLDGTSYNPIGTTPDASNWGSLQPNWVSGLGSTATLFGVVSAVNGSAAAVAAITQEFTVSLTSTGLTYTAIGGTTVPLPAAVWLLGSGLLGLAGVARRKIAG